MGTRPVCMTFSLVQRVESLDKPPSLVILTGGVQRPVYGTSVSAQSAPAHGWSSGMVRVLELESVEPFHQLLLHLARRRSNELVVRVPLMPELNVAPPQLTSCSLRRWRKTTHRPADTPRHFVLGQGQRAHAARVGVVHGQGRKMLEKVVSRECKSRKPITIRGTALVGPLGIRGVQQQLTPGTPDVP